MIEIEAPAKLNLTLEVLGRRPDGYHEIASVMQTIDLVDTLTFEEDDDLVFTCDQQELTGRENLVIRAAALLGGVGESRERGARIHLQKRIPVAAGLGGGSSDAAASLAGLRALWKKDISAEHLLGLAARLGSDVPFFLLDGGTALAEGRGERITPLPSLPPAWAVVLVPAVSIPEKTRTLYGRLTAADFSDGRLTSRLITALQLGGCLTPEHFGNAFERLMFSQFAEVAAAGRHFLAAGAPRVHLTGSGPALYCLLPGMRIAARIYRRLQAEGCRVYLAKTRAWGLGNHAVLLN